MRVRMQASLGQHRCLRTGSACTRATDPSSESAGPTLSTSVTKSCQSAFRGRNAARAVRFSRRRHRMTSGRWSTLKSHLAHFSNYTQAEGRLGNSAVTRLDALDENSLLGYAKYRRSHPFYAKEITIRNEQATINAFCKWAYKKGLHNTEKFEFVRISMRRTDKDEIRRAT